MSDDLSGLAGDLGRLFSPKSIAFIGASDNSISLRGRPLEFLLQHGYAGQIHIVSRTRSELRGIKTYRSIGEIPGHIDIVVVLIDAKGTVDIVKDCAAADVGFVLCLNAGFAETGADGAVLQNKIMEIATSASMRVIGPNSAGVLGSHAGLILGLSPAIDIAFFKDAGRSVAGPVGIVSQSGGLAFATQLRCMSKFGLGTSVVVSTGNEADLDIIDFLEYIVEDEYTTTIVLILEGLKDTDKLKTIARRAADRNKRIVVGKFGGTSAGRRAAASHSARVTGSDAAYDAFFRRVGMCRAGDEDEIADFAAVLTQCAIPAGRRVAILTTTGGAGVWLADACEQAGLDVPVLDQNTQDRLARILPSFGTMGNPVDLTAQGGDPSKSADYSEILDVVASSPSIDMIALIFNQANAGVIKREQKKLEHFVRHGKKPLVLSSAYLPSKESMSVAWDIGVPTFSSSRRVARSLRALADYGEFVRARPDKTSEPGSRSVSLPAFPTRALCEYESKAVLAALGIPFPPEALARSAAEAATLADKLGTAVALKVQSPGILHKTDIGGVILNVQGSAGVSQAYGTLIERARAQAPDADVHGVLVQKMTAPGIEMLAGVIRDSNFGHMIVVGFGGVYVEILDDTVVEPVPVTHARARDMLQRLRGWRILEGARGEDAADIEALCEVLVKLSDLAEAAGDRISEVDLNPIFVYARGSGLAIVDAMIIASRAASPTKPRKPASAAAN